MKNKKSDKGKYDYFCLDDILVPIKIKYKEKRKAKKKKRK